MRASIVAAVAILAHIGGLRSANAQGWEAMNVGARVSLRVNDSLLPPGLARRNAIVGLVANRDPDAVYLQITRGDTLRVPRANITRLAVSRGRSRTRSALRVALLEGIVIAAFPPPRGEYFDSRHLRVIGIGAGFGGLLGALWPPEDWKRLRP